MDGSLMTLWDIESRLPPGFRFHPSDEELVCCYLRGKIHSSQQMVSSPLLTMVEVDLHVREPWDLPVSAKLGDEEWYFFSSRDRKYATGSRTNRATRHGHWKATGKDKAIHGEHGTVMVGTRKTLVFYFGRAPNGRKSDWVMHEFRLVSSSAATTPPMQEDWVLCRVFHKVKGETDHLVNTITSPPAPCSTPPAPCSPPLAHCSPLPAADNLDAQLFHPIISGGQLLGDDRISGLIMDGRQDAMLDDPAMIQQAAACGFVQSSESTDARSPQMEDMVGYIWDMERVMLQSGYCFHAPRI